MRKAIALGALVLILESWPAAAQEDSERRLVVSGTGEVSAPPDMAMISAGVVVQGDTASAALAENTRAMNAVLEALGASGVAPEDIRTSRFAIIPLYEVRRPDAATQEPPRILGYQVSNQVQATVDDLDRLGATLDAVVDAGANSIDGLSFGIADPKALLDRVRDAAVADAIAKAERYAAAAGVELGDVISIEEGGFVQPRPMMRAEAMEASVPISPGQTELTASVTMEFAIE